MKMVAKIPSGVLKGLRFLAGASSIGLGVAILAPLAVVGDVLSILNMVGAILVKQGDKLNPWARKLGRYCGEKFMEWVYSEEVAHA